MVDKEKLIYLHCETHSLWDSKSKKATIEISPENCKIEFIWKCRVQLTNIIAFIKEVPKSCCLGCDNVTTDVG
jgi:hypothetical protein